MEEGRELMTANELMKSSPSSLCFTGHFQGHLRKADLDQLTCKLFLHIYSFNLERISKECAHICIRTDTGGTTHPLFSQLLLQGCQTTLFPQHAAVPSAKDKDSGCVYVYGYLLIQINSHFRFRINCLHAPWAQHSQRMGMTSEAVLFHFFIKLF